MKKLIIANWKMNPLTEAQAIKLARASDRSDVVIAPPFLFIEAVSHVIKKAKLSAQDLAWEDPEKGAYTGEISAKMLKDAEVKYVILGHSERRRLGKETDAIIARKVKIALKGGFRVVLCVGEPISVRRRGLVASRKFIQSQLKGALGKIKSSTNNRGFLIAYEPIWSIGTGRNDTPEDAALMAVFIKKLLSKNYKLKTKVLYGGSIDSKNAGAFLDKKEINGLLVGGASIRINEFGHILKIQ